MKKVFGVVVVGVMLLVAGTASAQQSLTDKDRAEIQELSAKYAKALGGCAAEDYADVFAARDRLLRQQHPRRSGRPRAPDGARAQRAPLHRTPQRRPRAGSANRCRW